MLYDHQDPLEGSPHQIDGDGGKTFFHVIAIVMALHIMLLSLKKGTAGGGAERV
jgi:hypothetical protein